MNQNYIFVINLLLLFLTKDLLAEENSGKIKEENKIVEEKRLTGEEFYQSKYESIYSSEKLKEALLDTVDDHKELNMTEKQKIIFICGFFQGINDYSSLN